ncbi:Ribosomal L1 domain-containing protein 1 [Coelomomyces lativittatus]|nr:Ribosomal L1 domain-containing protein 1 [Coelomomyces lativittatus]KAJ1516674.1 Ribosomal L1 domain-containing protein 1 [Coelomomyces lativittatus]KAJ1518405.1 Ribosomal L1 domain-containing protein 1 [Coelomomyces lativittatus]
MTHHAPTSFMYDLNQLFQAHHALTQYQLHHQETDLLTDYAPVHLIFHFHRMLKKKPSTPLFLTLPYSPSTLHVKPEEDQEENPTRICIFVKDGVDKSTLLNSIHATFPYVKVIPIFKLKTKYKIFEQRRVLLKSHELFLSDSRVYGLLPKLLGKTFYQHKKWPMKIRLDQLSTTLLHTCLRTVMYTIPTGHCLSLPIGSLTLLSKDQFKANIDHCIHQLLSSISSPSDNKKNENVSNWMYLQQLGLQVHGTPVLPFYINVHAIPSHESKLVYTKSEWSHVMSLNDDHEELEIPSDFCFSDDDEEVEVEKEVVKVIRTKKRKI